jgi:hypothetical protein
MTIVVMRIRMERPQQKALPVIYDAIDSDEFPLMADMPVDAARLLRAFRRLSAQHNSDSIAFFEALEKVIRRAKVRVYGDGRVIPIDA